MNITAAGQFTNWTHQKTLSGQEVPSGSGIDIRIETPNGATVTVQRRVDGLISDEGTYTVATSTNFIGARTTEYRVGVKTGNFGTGAFNVGISG